MMPTPSTQALNNAQGSAGLIHSPYRLVCIPANAYPKGMIVDAKPQRNRGMDHHPVITQENIKSHTVFNETEVVGLTEYGAVISFLVKINGLLPILIPKK